MEATNRSEEINISKNFNIQNSNIIYNLEDFSATSVNTWTFSCIYLILIGWYRTISRCF